MAQAVNSKVGLDLVKKAYERASKRIVDGVQGESEPATEHGGVSFVSVVPRANAKAINDKVPHGEMKKAIKQGYYVKDDRKTTAKLYSTQYQNQFTTPHMSGEFSCIKEDGSLARVLVLCAPHRLSENQSTRDCVFIEPGSLAVAQCNTQSTEVAPVRRSEEALGRVLAAGVSSKAMVPKRKYILLTPDAKSWAGPITIETARSSGAGTAHYKVRQYGCDFESCYLMAGLANVEKFKKVGNEVLVPGNAVAVDVTDTCGALRFGRVGDLSNKLIHTGLEPVIITNDGVEFDAGDGQKLDRQAAMRKLILEKDLKEEDAKGLLDKAASEGKVSVLIKKANPTFINTLEGSDRPDSTKRHLESPEQVPQYTREPHYSYEDPHLVSTNAEPHLPSIPLTAAAMGSPEVFDGSILASLADKTSLSDVALEYIPDMEKAVDKIGRLLFLLWWQYDKFREKYAPSELVVLESDLRGLMSKLGQLTYKLCNRFKDV